MSQPVSANFANPNLVAFKNIHQISPELAAEFQKCNVEGYVGPKLVNSLLYRMVAKVSGDSDQLRIITKLACEILAHSELSKLVEVNARYGQKKFTLLILASYVGNVEVVAALVQLKANVNLRTDGGNTALMSAALNKKLEPSRRVAATQLLCHHGAQINPSIYIGACNQKLTAIELILKNGDLSAESVDAAKRLIEMGADINVEDGINPKGFGGTAFKRALARGAYNWLSIIIQLGGKPSERPQYKYDYPESTNTLLLQNGANWESWETPRDIEQIDFLLSRGLKPTSIEDLLFLSVPCLKLLMQHGVDLTDRPKRDTDALEFSPSVEHFDLMLSLGYPVTPKAIATYYFLGASEAKLTAALDQMSPPTLEQITVSIQVANDAKICPKSLGLAYKKLLTYFIERTQGSLDPTDGSISPLIYASMQEGMVDIVKALIGRGASLDYRSLEALEPRKFKALTTNVFDETTERLEIPGRTEFGCRQIPVGSTAIEAARLARRKDNFDFLKKAYHAKILSLFPPQSGMILDLVNIIGEYDELLNSDYTLTQAELTAPYDVEVSEERAREINWQHLRTFNRYDCREFGIFPHIEKEIKFFPDF